MRKSVYLCGPISGLEYNAARLSWRNEVSNALNDSNIDALSPMRFKSYLEAEKDLASGNDYAGVNVLSTARGIVARDRYDTQRCDVVLCNLLGSKKVSIGSMIELGWCDSMRIPLVMIMENEGNIHDHAMVRELADFIVPTVDEAVEVIRAILTPGV